MHNEAPTLREKPKTEVPAWLDQNWSRGQAAEVQTRTSAFQGAKPRLSSHLPDHPIARILVPTDFSPCAAKAVEFAVALAGQCLASLTLLHVIDINTQYAGAESLPAAEMMKRLWEKGASQMSNLASALSEQVETQTALEEGLPWEQIVERSRQADLVILGRDKPKPVWKLFSKHTAQRVIEHAECPVLVVREPR